MKKALLAGICFVIISLVMVNGTFALPDLDQVFADLTSILGEWGLPEKGGADTPVHVSLVTQQANRSLFPGGTASSTTVVRNEGSGDIYFRLVYAIQYDQASWHKLDIQFAAEPGFEEHDWQDIIASNGTKYKMKVFTYTRPLTAGTDSAGITLTITMDQSMTSEEISRYRTDFLKTQALAMDPTPFINKGIAAATEALDLALPLETLNPF